MKFEVSWPFIEGEETQNRFLRWLGFLIRTVLVIFDLQVALILPTKFRVNWPFSAEKEAQNRFSN